MAFHWFHNRGDEPRRTRFVSLRNSYHGETIGALSVGDIPLYRRVYAPLLLEPLFAPSPAAYAAREGQSAAPSAEEAPAALAPLLDEHPGDGCAPTLQPRVQSARRTPIDDPVYLKSALSQCHLHGQLLTP